MERLLQALRDANYQRRPGMRPRHATANRLDPGQIGDVALRQIGWTRAANRDLYNRRAPRYAGATVEEIGRVWRTKAMRMCLLWCVCVCHGVRGRVRATLHQRRFKLGVVRLMPPPHL